MKKLIALLLVLAMAIGLVACGAKEVATPAATEAAPAAKEEAPAAKEEAPAEEHEPVVLEVSIVEADWMDTWLDDLKPMFEEEYPWITLQDVGSGEDKQVFTSTRASANNLPPVSEVAPRDTWKDLVDAGMLLDVTGYDAAADIPQNYLDFFTHNGVTYGLTQGAAFDALYVNMAVLKEAGWDSVPTCWDEFIQCCADIQAKTDATPITYVGTSNPGCFMMLENIAANVVAGELGGAAAFENAVKTGTLKLSDYPEVAERFNQLPQYMLEGSTGNKEDDVIAIMTDGTCAFAFAGNWIAASVCAGIEEATGDASMVAMIAPPFNDAGEDLYLAAVPENGFGIAKVDDENLAEARDIFFEWIMEPEHFKYIQNARGTIPVLTSLTEEDIVLPDAAVGFQAQTQKVNVFTRIATCVGSEVLSDCGTSLRDFYAGNMDVGTVLSKISDRWAADPIA